MRRLVRTILNRLFTINKIESFFSNNKIKIIKLAYRRGKIFNNIIPWWDKNIHNWYNFILIFMNLKKKTNIYLKNGFTFEMYNKLRYLEDFSLYMNKISKNNISLFNRNGGIIAKIDKYFIIYPNQFEAIMLIEEVFLQNSYNKFDIKNKIIMNIGGYTGDTAIFYISKGAEKVYVYEINKQLFKILEKNIKINHLEKKIIAYNMGISNKKKQAIFYLDKHVGSSGIFKSRYDNREVIDKYSVELYPFNEILKEPIDILHMDCEGCEYDVLELILKHNLINKIKEGIILEGHDIDEKRNIKYLISILEKLGFNNVHQVGTSPAIIYSKK